jgi:hypothetical protein
MERKPRFKKDSLQKKAWVKPVLKRIPVDDEEALLEYCKGKPYDVKQLKEVIKTKLPRYRRE